MVLLYNKIKTHTQDNGLMVNNKDQASKLILMEEHLLEYLRIINSMEKAYLHISMVDVILGTLLKISLEKGNLQILIKLNNMAISAKEKFYLKNYELFNLSI